MQIYKVVITVIIIVFSLPCRGISQNYMWDIYYKRSIPAYSTYFSKNFGISITIPSSFIDLHKYYITGPMPNHAHRVIVNSMYGPVFKTKNKECIVMYPWNIYPPLPMTKQEKQMAKATIMLNRKFNGDTSTAKPKLPNLNLVPRHQITGELKSFSRLYDYRGHPLSDTVHFHFNDHVTLIAGKKAKQMFNADTVYIYNLPLHHPYHKKYTYRTGLVLFKKNRGTLLFRLLFTPKGKKDEWKYINMLSGHVWYDEDFKQDKR